MVRQNTEGDREDCGGTLTRHCRRAQRGRPRTQQHRQRIVQQQWTHSPAAVAVYRLTAAAGSAVAVYRLTAADPGPSSIGSVSYNIS
ncbi:hypothetical protein AALO_G00132760 [Alosa alosa]|uniref:Uncharacterized protein n=1 Tax=Alosa alosa TaxID=278164 RepID=A0AAV6GMZ3_9TELE|nr:hypothetical protein AALO_G00132760 [Alosa alosa]